MRELSRIPAALRIATLASSAALAVGCATVYAPPTDQLAVADAAVADALSADATQYAAPELNAAQRKLTRAHDALGTGDNGVARELAEEAEVDARLAATRARAAKAVRAAAEVQTSNRALREQVERAPQ